ncbi:MAG: c-type cytochrome [Paracoccaceae bacterium]
MTLTGKLLCAAAIAAAGAVFAAEATNPAAKARQELMDGIAKNVELLAGMGKGKVAFDAGQAEAAKAAIVAGAGKIPEAFKANETDPKSRAKPEIWANWSSFEAKAAKLGEAAGGLDVSTAGSIKGAMDGLGKVCGGCHQDFKAQG